MFIRGLSSPGIERSPRALASRLKPGQTVISFAAGVSLARLEAAIPPGVDAGLSESDARWLAASMMAGTAALALEPHFPFDEMKKLTSVEFAADNADAADSRGFFGLKKDGCTEKTFNTEAQSARRKKR